MDCTDSEFITNNCVFQSRQGEAGQCEWSLIGEFCLRTREFCIGGYPVRPLNTPDPQGEFPDLRVR